MNKDKVLEVAREVFSSPPITHIGAEKLVAFAALIEREVSKSLQAELHKARTDAAVMAAAYLNQIKPCPNCGSTETRIVSEYAGGEVVCTADQCEDCGHQWNVG